MMMSEKYKTAPLEKAQQLMQGTAYGYRTLGMPVNGFESNIANLNATIINGFLQDQVVPNKMIFCANGIAHHEEFAQLVESKVSHIPPMSALNKPRIKAGYVGGESRIYYEVPSTTVMLCYESVPWTHPDMPVFSVLNILMGNATGFSMGGPGKGMHCRAIRRGKSTSINKDSVP